ncbi:hypothetical protein N6H14_08930 [Paenibacillus sp. CC-CFT747]|nr:hypothetical protein N6H14_08930 [Paenibacillus sp. CC-CFT747]
MMGRSGQNTEFIPRNGIDHIVGGDRTVQHRDMDARVGNVAAGCLEQEQPFLDPKQGRRLLEIGHDGG